MGDKRRLDGTMVQKRFPYLLFGFSFLFFAFVMWCAPYSSDDLEFALLDYKGIDGYLTFVLQYGNGRVLGNAGAILMVKCRALCILAKAFVLSSCVVLFPSVLGLRSTLDYLLSFLLFAAVDPAVFGEVYAWTSGFNNYVPPIWLSLVIVYMIQQYPNIQKRLVKLLICAAVFVLGTTSQLFIEHSSCVNVLLALCFVLMSLKGGRKRSAVPSRIWLAATLTGIAVMLLVPTLFYVEGNHTETYRQTYLGSLPELAYALAANAIQLSNHYFGINELPICFGAITTVYLTRNRRSGKANRVLYGISAASLVFLLLSMLLSVDGYLGQAALIQHAIDSIFAVLPFAVWVLAALKLDSPLRNRMLFLLAFALISLAPLLVVSPIPTRVIYQSYVFVMLAALLCFSQIEGHLIGKPGRYVQSLAFTASVLLALVIGSVFLSIHSMAQMRDQHIREEIANGATEVVIFRLPYVYTTWDHLWSQELYYTAGLDRTVEFSSLDIASWMNQYH